MCVLSFVLVRARLHPDTRREARGAFGGGAFAVEGEEAEEDFVAEGGAALAVAFDDDGSIGSLGFAIAVGLRSYGRVFVALRRRSGLHRLI